MKQKLSKIFALLAGLALPVLTAPNTFAWGPARTTYTNEAPAHKAVFNSITNNAWVGDERDFVRIVEKGVNGTYTSQLKVEPGKQYEVFIYYHNDASATFNDADHQYVGVARDVRVNSYFPHELSKGERGIVSSTITATNTDPAAVWDEAYITATEDMTLHYVTGSAKIFNNYGVNGSVLSTNLFSAKGTFIGLNELNGVILGCDEYSGVILYTLQTKAVDVNVEPDDPCKDDPSKCEEPDPPCVSPDDCPKPDDPDPEPEPEPTPCVGEECDEPCEGEDCEKPTPKPVDPVEPDDVTPKPTDPNDPAAPNQPTTPSELPNTGPVEVVLALVLILVIFAGVYYWYRTHNAVKKETKKARGRK